MAAAAFAAPFQQPLVPMVLPNDPARMNQVISPECSTFLKKARMVAFEEHGSDSEKREVDANVGDPHTSWDIARKKLIHWTTTPLNEDTIDKAREAFQVLQDLRTRQLEALITNETRTIQEEEAYAIIDCLSVASGWGQWDETLGTKVGPRDFGSFNVLLHEAHLPSSKEHGFGFLIQSIEKIDCSNPVTPFLFAAADERMEQVDQERFLMMLLMAHDQDSRSKLIAPFMGVRHTHKTALYLAARSGRANVLKSMLSCLKDSDCFKLLMVKDWRSYNALLAAVAMENVDATKAILETIPRFHSKDHAAELLFSADKIEHTALHLAISTNNNAVAVALLKAIEKHVVPREESPKAIEKHVVPREESPSTTEKLDKLLMNVITYAIQLNRTDMITETLKRTPAVISKGLVKKAFHLPNTIGEIMSNVLAPKLQMNTETGTLWSPYVSLGSGPWVKKISCRLPKPDEDFAISKEKDEGVFTDPRIVPFKEQFESEKGPDPCLVLRILACPLTIMEHCGYLKEAAESLRSLLLEEPKVPCQAHRLPECLLTSTDVLQGLTSVNSGALRTPLAEGVLAKWWIEFELYYHLDIFLNVLHVALACFLTFASRSRRTWNTSFVVCFFCSAILILKDVLDKLFQILPSARYLVDKFFQALRSKSHGEDTEITRRLNRPVRQLADYFLELVDIGRLFVQIFALYCLRHQRAGQAADIPTKTVTAVWVFFWWCHCLFDLRGLRCVGPRLLPIFWAISDIAVRSFGLVVLFLLAASTHAFYVLAVRQGFSPIYAAVVHMYRLGVLGDFDMFELEGKDPTLVAAGEGVWEPKEPEASDLYWHVHGLFFVVTTLILLLLMNLFINILGSSYDRSLDMAEELFTITRAKLVLEYEAAFIPRLLGKCKVSVTSDVAHEPTSSVTSDVAHEPTNSCSNIRGKEEQTFRIVLRAEVEPMDRSMRNFVRQQLESFEKNLNKRLDQLCANGKGTRDFATRHPESMMSTGYGLDTPHGSMPLQTPTTSMAYPSSPQLSTSNNPGSRMRLAPQGSFDLPTRTLSYHQSKSYVEGSSSPTQYTPMIIQSDLTEPASTAEPVVVLSPSEQLRSKYPTNTAAL